MAHDPQCRGSKLRSKHVPLQHVGKVPLHLGAPHDPQLRMSLCRLVHVPEQQVGVAAEHYRRECQLSSTFQRWGELGGLGEALTTMLQDPQREGFVAKSAQAPEQHAGVVPVQFLAQFPQCVGSLLKFEHAPEQQVGWAIEHCHDYICQLFYQPKKVHCIEWEVENGPSHCKIHSVRHCY